MRSLRPLLIPAIGFLLSAEIARADIITAEYDVSHGFTFSPLGGVTIPPSFEFSVAALTAPGGGFDGSSGSVMFGPGGGSQSREANSMGSLSSATAGASATLSPFTLGGSVSGVVRSTGNLTSMPDGLCCAISSASVVLVGGTAAKRGSIAYAPNMSFEGAHLEFSRRGLENCHGGEDVCDPIAFKVLDLNTGSVTQGSLFDLSSHMGGDGTFSWKNGTLALDAQNFSFNLQMDSPFTVQQGTADLEVVKGFITVSEGTGLFAGLLPAIGTSGTFSVPFNTSLLLDYDLGDFNGDPLQVQFTLGGSGAVCAPVPEPSTWSIMLLGLGIVGLAVQRRRDAKVLSV